MGAKTWMIVYAEADAATALSGAPVLDRAASRALAEKLFPGKRLKEIADGCLGYTNPPGDEIRVGCFPGVSIVAASDFALDRPSTLPRRFIEAAAGRRVYLHAMHSVVDWAAFAVWEQGTLVRSLSLAPDNGVLENLGTPLPFEEPYWAGKHPVEIDSDDETKKYPLPFHPLELGSDALFAFFGYRLEGWEEQLGLKVESIPLCAFQRRVWWKLWL
jgi:hypothetical protein